MYVEISVPPGVFAISLWANSRVKRILASLELPGNKIDIEVEK